MSGGGIPVSEEENGTLTGVDAVIDKDLASSRLAVDIKAEVLMFLTTVERVALNYNTPQRVDLERLGLVEAQRYLRAGQFPPGSMDPQDRSGGQVRRERRRPSNCLQA